MSNIYAQKFDIKKLSTNEGLPAGQIGYLVQDKDNYIWMSSYYGLLRYDGIETQVYSTEHGLRNNLIYHVYIDSSDRLWISAEGAGIGFMQEDSVYYPEYFAPLDTLTVTYMKESSDGRYWFSTFEEGVFIWDGNEFEQISEKEGLPSNTVWHTRFDDNGEAWIATQNGVGIYDGDSIRVINADNGLSGSAAYSFAEEVDGTIWISTNSGVTTFDGTNWEQIRTINGKALRYVYDVYVDRDGLVWIGTERDGIYWYDGESYTQISKTNNLSSNYTYTFNEDNDGRIWVATDENGVNIFRDKNFRIYDTPDFVGGESVNVMYKKDEDLWLATDNGLTKFDVDGNSTHYQLPDEIAMYKEIWDIDELPNGNLLILNSNSLLFEFDGQTFSDYGTEKGFPWVYLHDVMVDGEVIWLASESGLRKYENGRHTTYTTENGLKDNFVNSLYKDRDGFIWAVTEEGVNKVTPDSIITFSFEDGIAGSSVNLITQSPNGNYWVGTNAGFTELVMDENNKPVSISNFSLAEEFLQEPLFLQFDGEGNLWMGTSGGIHFFDKNELDFSESGPKDGIFMPLQDYGKGIEMNYLSSLEDEDGNLWFGTYTHGLIQYKAGVKPKLKPSPEPFIRAIDINGEAANPDEFTTKELAYDENNITVRFGAFYFEYPERVFYKYRLKGLQEDWQDGYGDTETNYSHLSPGKYSFEVQAKSIESAWGEPVTLAEIHILKPFWKTSWFYGVMGFVFFGIAATIIKGFLMYFEKRKLGEQVNERTAELRGALSEKDMLIKEIHHRVKNNMAVVSGLLELQGWKIKNKEAKAALENSKMRIQTMSSIHEKLYQNDNLADIEFGKFAEDLVFKISGSLKGTDKDIKVHLDIAPVELNVNAAIPCGLILNEALSNCYEHGFKKKKRGNVHISFKEHDEDRFELIVKDDGEGIPEKILEGERSSLGITLIYSLASQVNGEAIITNNNGACIRVLIGKQI